MVVMYLKKKAAVKLENLTFKVKFDLEVQGQLPPKTIGLLTLKRLGHFFQKVILFSNVVQHQCNIFI